MISAAAADALRAGHREWNSAHDTSGCAEGRLQGGIGSGGGNGRGMVLQAPGDGGRSPGHLDMNAGDFPKKNWNGM